MRLFAGVVFAASSLSLFGAEPLFPQPLHLTRTIEDPIAGTSITVEEYCAGDQVVSVAGERVTIVDYAKQEMTEIDRAAGTWSVARFDEIAKALSASDPRPGRRDVATNSDGTSKPTWVSRPLGARTSSRGRSLVAYELTAEDPGSEHMRLEVSVDTNVRLTRSAVEALIGASFPNPRREEHEAILRAAGAHGAQRIRPASESSLPADFALPIEQILSVDFEGRTLTLRNTIVDVRSELPPDALRRIPPGARQVEPRAVRIVREALELDSPPAVPASQP